MNLKQVVFLSICLHNVCTLSTTCTPHTTEYPFSPKGPWNAAIPSNPKLDPDSQHIAQRLSDGSHPIVVQLYAYGMPIYYANSTTTRYDVTCSKPYHGPCDLEKYSPVPIPDGVWPSYGTDGHVAVIDTDTCKSYEWWVARKKSPSEPYGTTTNWGAVIDLNSFAGCHNKTDAAVAADVSVLSGLGRVSDVLKGDIQHTLAFTSDITCKGKLKWPAGHTDGRSSEPCIQEGQRVQLDPSVDIHSLHLQPGELMIAKALQTYGAICVDTSGVRIGFYFEDNSHGRCHNYTGHGMSPCPWWAKSKDNPYYTHAGWDKDGFQLKKIPWDKLRILDQWDGQ